jgi:hypothetical protein
LHHLALPIKKKRTSDAQGRRKKEFKERADNAKPYFDNWFKAEVEVDSDLNGVDLNDFILVFLN